MVQRYEQTRKLQWYKRGAAYPITAFFNYARYKRGAAYLIKQQQKQADKPAPS